MSPGSQAKNMGTKPEQGLAQSNSPHTGKTPQPSMAWVLASLVIPVASTLLCAHRRLPSMRPQHVEVPLSTSVHTRAHTHTYTHTCPLFSGECS